MLAELTKEGDFGRTLAVSGFADSPICIVLCYFTYEKRMSEKLGVYEREREERRREGGRAIFILESSTEGGVVTTG